MRAFLVFQILKAKNWLYFLVSDQRKDIYCDISQRANKIFFISCCYFYESSGQNRISIVFFR